MSGSKFLAGFIVGGAIGAIAGILLAPKSGAETRAMLADTTRDLAKRADETVKEIQDLACDVNVNEIKAHEIKDKLQNMLNKQKDEPQAEG